MKDKETAKQNQTLTLFIPSAGPTAVKQAKGM